MMTKDFKEARIVYQDASFTLYVYNEQGAAGITYIVPPYAGRSGEITLPMINALIEVGRIVYVFRINDGCQANKNTSMDDLALAHDRFLKIIGEPVDVFCMCQGWTFLPFAASKLNQGKAKSISMFASPINTKTGEENNIEKYCKTINMDAHRMAVELNNGNQSGLSQWVSFFLNDPMPIAYTQFVDLYTLTMAGDHAGVKKWWRNYNWNVDYRPIPGVLFLQMLEWHFKNNDLYEGRFKVLGETVNLKNITCPFSVYAGYDDDITHQRQATDVLKVIGSKIKHAEVFKGRTIEELKLDGIESNKDETIGHTAPYVKGWCIQSVLMEKGYIS